MAASTAVSLSMVADMVAGKAIPSVNGNKEIIGIVNATDGGTSSTSPNIIVTTFGPSEAKAISGTNNAGDFVIQSGTNGYASTHNGIPNNSFNYEVGIPGNAFSSTCTAASNCLGSLYVNFEVR